MLLEIGSLIYTVVPGFSVLGYRDSLDLEHYVPGTKSGSKVFFEDTKRMGFPLVFVTVVVHLNSDL